MTTHTHILHTEEKKKQMHWKHAGTHRHSLHTHKEEAHKHILHRENSGRSYSGELRCENAFSSSRLHTLSDPSPPLSEKHFPFRCINRNTHIVSTLPHIFKLYETDSLLFCVFLHAVVTGRDLGRLSPPQ